jgi:DNA-binding MarR family transcriptional regulator
MQQSKNAINVEDIVLFRKHLRALEREISQSIKTEGSCCGVTLAQCHVLLELADAGSISLTGLKDRLILDKSTVSRTIDTLVKNGSVERREAETDRRFSQLELTQTGSEEVKRINGFCNDRYQLLFSMIEEGSRKDMIENIRLLSGKMAELRNMLGKGCM